MTLTIRRCTTSPATHWPDPSYFCPACHPACRGKGEWLSLRSTQWGRQQPRDRIFTLNKNFGKLWIQCTGRHQQADQIAMGKLVYLTPPQKYCMYKLRRKSSHLSNLYRFVPSAVICNTFRQKAQNPRNYIHVALHFQKEFYSFFK